MLGTPVPNDGDVELLGTFARLMCGETDPKQELRVELSRHAGRCYVGLRVYHRDSRNHWCPTPNQGLNLRADELKGLAEILEAAARRPGIRRKIVR